MTGKINMLYFPFIKIRKKLKDINFLQYTIMP